MVGHVFGVIYDRGRPPFGNLYIIVLRYNSTILISFSWNSNMAKLLKKPLKLACVQLSTGMRTPVILLEV
jgi:hypothetical protein